MYETGTYPISNMYDGDYTTYAWTAANQAVGDTMTYTLNQTIGIDDVTFVFSGSDCLSDGAVIEISADGSQWTTIGEVDRSYLESHNYRYTAMAKVRKHSMCVCASRPSMPTHGCGSTK